MSENQTLFCPIFGHLYNICNKNNNDMKSKSWRWGQHQPQLPSKLMTTTIIITETGPIISIDANLPVIDID